jgi:hypothetical protein
VIFITNLAYKSPVHLAILANDGDQSRRPATVMPAKPISIFRYMLQEQGHLYPESDRESVHQ